MSFEKIHLCLQPRNPDYGLLKRQATSNLDENGERPKNMRREKFFCMSLGRFAQASTAAALIALVLTGVARADAIEDFVVNGTATNVSGGSLDSCGAGAFCSFSGTMMVDVTIGTVTAYDITFPGVTVFDNCCFAQGAFAGGWLADSLNSADQALRLDFSTSPTPESLVGFESGSITGLEVISPSSRIYANFTGSITPAPEPSSLALLGPGLLCCLGIGLVGVRSKAALLKEDLLLSGAFSSCLGNSGPDYAHALARDLRM